MPPLLKLHFLFFLSLLLISNLHLSNLQPTPYMDELFHIPQAQSYCNNLPFKLPPYDPSLTTPPALYIPPLLLHVFTLRKIPCSVFNLRLSSALYTCLTLPLIFRTVTLLHPPVFSSPSPRALLPTLVLFLHPVSFFYSHLFYTDPLALLLILTSLFYSLSNRPNLSALAAFLSSLSRQTSIIWHVYILLQTLTIPLIQKPSKTPFQHFKSSLPTLLPHTPYFLLYLLFIYFNSSITLGDKSNHIPIIHHAMLPYFLAFHAISFLPFQLSARKSLYRQFRLVISNPYFLTFTLLLTLFLSALIITTADYVHPFLLADNRHFTFYLYKRFLLRSNYHRLLPLPIYVWGFLSPFLELRLLAQDLHLQNQNQNHSEFHLKTQRFITCQHFLDILLVLCAALTLVPAPLMEPRYFIVASAIWSLRRVARVTEPMSSEVLLLMVLGLVVLNFAFWYVFVGFPFDRPIDQHMPNDLSPGRFMF